MGRTSKLKLVLVKRAGVTCSYQILAGKDLFGRTDEQKTFNRILKNHPGMGKHPRKKQKTSKNEKPPVKALGIEALTDDALKDDEERMLESMLFGTEFIPKDGKDFEGDEGAPEEGDDDNEEGGREMGHLMDSDVMFFTSLHSPVPLSLPWPSPALFR